MTQAKNAHRQVRWRKPVARSPWKRPPEVLRVTEYQLVQALESRQGMLWANIRRRAIVAGYEWARAGHRIRTLRRDGTASLLAMLVALLHCSDIRTGFIGRPREGGGPWHRYTVEDLAFFAYGVKDVAAQRMARRAIDVIINLGWAYPTVQVNRYDEETHVIRGEPGVRRLNWTALCKAAQTSWYLDKAQEHARAKEEAAREKARRQEQREKPQKSKGYSPAPLGWDAYESALKSHTDHPAGNGGTPPSTGDPPESSAGGQQHVAAIKNLLDA